MFGSWVTSGAPGGALPSPKSSLLLHLSMLAHYKRSLFGRRVTLLSAATFEFRAEAQKPILCDTDCHVVVTTSSATDLRPDTNCDLAITSASSQTPLGVIDLFNESSYMLASFEVQRKSQAQWTSKPSCTRICTLGGLAVCACRPKPDMVWSAPAVMQSQQGPAESAAASKSDKFDP